MKKAKKREKPLIIGHLGHFYDAINNDTKIEQTRKCSRFWHSEPKDFVGEVIFHLQDYAIGIEEDIDIRVEDWIELHKEESPELEGVALYELIIDSLSQVFIPLIIEPKDLLIALYAHKDKFLILESSEVFSIIMEILGILHLYVDKSLEMLDLWEHELKYSNWSPQEVDEFFGKRTKELYFKEPTLEDYKAACSTVERFSDYVNQNNIGHRLLDLVKRLEAWHYLTVGSFERLAQGRQLSLSEADNNIIEALGRDTVKGEDLAVKAGYPYNSNFKTTCATLRKRKILGNKSPGYFLEPKYHYLLDKSD